MNSFSSWFIWCFIVLIFLEYPSYYCYFIWVSIEALYSTSCSFVSYSSFCSLAFIDSLLAWVSYSSLFLISLSNKILISFSFALISSSYFCLSLFSRRFKVFSYLDFNSINIFFWVSSASWESWSFFLCTSSASFCDKTSNLDLIFFSYSASSSFSF